MPSPLEWKEFRRHPFRAVRRYSGQTAEIDAIELHRSNIEEIALPVGGDLGDDLRLADAAGTPDVEGHTFTDQRMKALRSVLKVSPDSDPFGDSGRGGAHRLAEAPVAFPMEM